MAADRWGAKATQEETKMTPEQFAAAWKRCAAKALQGESVKTPEGPVYVRCGRRITAATMCLHRLGHSSSCSPHFANICDAPLPKEKRCILTVGHKSKCMPVFPR